MGMQWGMRRKGAAKKEALVLATAAIAVAVSVAPITEDYVDTDCYSHPDFVHE